MILRIIFDECIPKRLSLDFKKFQVVTVPKAGFSGYKNGKLLRAIEKKYDVFVTVDSNIEYQQNLSGYKIAILILSAKSNSYEDLKLLVPKIIKQLKKITPGNIYIIK